MNITDFNYQLPDELIAQYPCAQRTASRLLHLTGQGAIKDGLITDMLDFLQPNDLLVLNDTKVVPARLFGHKNSGGKLEILLERVLTNNQFLAQIRASKSPKHGQEIIIDADPAVTLSVLGREGNFFRLGINQPVDLIAWFERVGHIPLPPYIQRQDELSDSQRYQTVFATQPGAVAAPTAGLHYDESLLAQIRNKGVQIEKITLHVGAGTYQPVRVDTIEQHKMHSEWVQVDESVCRAIHNTKREGCRVVAVGTTVVRGLETAAARVTDSAKQKGILIEPYQGDTDIFIYPGFNFNIVDALQTNFHLPQSTLLMLVSAFAGYAPIMQAYQYAIKHKYRFFSYGDAMLLERSA